jgi:hypothetical protein
MNRLCGHGPRAIVVGLETDLAAPAQRRLDRVHTGAGAVHGHVAGAGPAGPAPGLRQLIYS